jgi:hypothetical protein
MDEAVGVILIAGPVVFAIGAVFWRLDYERPPAESLPLIHADRRRRLWIHSWMLVAMFVSSAGVAGFASLARPAVFGAAVYLLGVGCMTVSLTFNLTVLPWVTERQVADGVPPSGFAVLRQWSGLLYVVHMLASYTGFAALGGAILASDVLPSWSGWVGLVLGVLCLAGFAGTRFSGPFNPPILAHTYTGLLGVVLLAT